MLIILIKNYRRAEDMIQNYIVKINFILENIINIWKYLQQNIINILINASQ